MGRSYRFASLLHQMMIHEEAPSAKMLARRLGLPLSTLYAYAENRRTFSADDVGALFLATGDRRVVDLALSGCRICWFEIPECDGWLDETVFAEAIAAQEELTDVLKEIRLALVDGRIDRRELARIRREYDQAQSQLARLMACVDKASSERQAKR